MRRSSALPAATTIRTRVLSPVLSLALLAAIAASAVFWLLDRDHQAPSELAINLFSVVVPAVYAGVGAVLTARRPGNSVGWLCLMIGLVWGILNVGEAVAVWAADHGRITLASWAGVVDPLWLVAVGLTSHLALRLPSGQLLSHRWRLYSWLCSVVIVVVSVVAVSQPGPTLDLPGTENPLGVSALRPFESVFVLLILCFVGSVVSLLLRYRRADRIERLQIRWIALGGAVILVVGTSIAVPTAMGILSVSGGLPLPVAALDDVANIAIPLSIGIAVLRYRLYDIDVIINRTLVYGLLTATLAATYVGLVVLFQLALRPLTHESGLATATSTLVVAALFRPARARIQRTVDRRFYRSKYDATRTLEAFGARLREQVDLETLSGELRLVISETMQPAHVSLWLRHQS
jgi:hypothetical protein